jgi:hypothetical protein
MRYIKFNTSQEAQAVCNRVFNAASLDGKFAQGTTAYAIPENVDYFTVPVLEGFDSYFTQSELNGIEQFKEEKQGRLVVDDLLNILKDQALSVNDSATLLNYVIPVIVICLSGNLRAAKVISNNLATTALYTAARKTWLVDRIQKEINKI